MQFRAGQVCWVERTQEGIRVNALIKCLHKRMERLVIADPGVYFGRLIVHN